MTLTLIFSIVTYIPASGKTKAGLKALDDLYAHLLEYFELPDNNDWKDNLEIVNAIKTFNIGNSKKLDDYFYERFEGYSSMGLKIGSEQYNEAIEKILSVNLPQNILVKNDIDDEYVRIEILHKSNIDDLSLTININGVSYTKPLTESQKNVLKEIYDNYEVKSNDTKEKFVSILNEFDNIKKIIEWWNKNIVNYSFEITPIGKVLACTNAVRIDSSLPNIIMKNTSK